VPGGLAAEPLAAALGRARLPGRGEILPPLRPASCAVLLDGAHNADKLGAFVDTLAGYRARRLHVVYGGLHGRTPDQALQRLAQRATTFAVTRPPVYGKQPRPLHEVAAAVAGHRGLILEPDAKRALHRTLAQCEEDDLLVITGSIYLAGALRGHWYADERVLLERTSWPSLTAR
jgi:folylpolyglutamate synthase/dihydropteroate synthase